MSLGTEEGPVAPGPPDSPSRLYRRVHWSQAPLVALFMLIVFKADLFSTNADVGDATLAMTVLFLLACGAIFTGANNAVKEIVKEDAIYRREADTEAGGRGIEIQQFSLTEKIPPRWVVSTLTFWKSPPVTPLMP